MSTSQIIYPIKRLHTDSNDLPALLSDKGVTVVMAHKRHLMNLFSQVPDLDLPELTLVARPGVFQQHFVLPSGIVLGETPDKFILRDAPNADAWKAGSKSKSIETLHLVCLEGNSVMQFSQLVSLSAMLANYVESDGYLFALTGASSKGKTSALKLAASIHGKPTGGDESTFINLYGTQNGLETRFEPRSGALLSLDELKNFQGTIRDFVFMLSEGGGKHRANSNSSARKSREFHCAALISSEEGIVEAVKREEGKNPSEGLLVRCLDIDVSDCEPVPQKTFDLIQSGYLENYGHISTVFASELLKHSPEELVKKVAEIACGIAKGECDVEPTPYALRAAQKFALVQLSGELGIEAGLFPVDGWKISDVVKWAWENSVGDPNVNFGTPTDKAIDVLRIYLETEKDKKIAVLEVPGAHCDYLSPGIHAPKGYYDNDTFYIFVDNIGSMSGGSAKRTALVKALLKKGFIDRCSDKNVAYERLPNGTKIRHYRIPRNKFLTGKENGEMDKD